VVGLENIVAEPSEIEEAIQDWARHNRSDPSEIRRTLERNPERMDDLKARLAAARAGRLLAEWAEARPEKIMPNKQ
jgi:FKBP-type peptidyl-prolyl cis-trans isomerase (trigger factor)